jgi:hypothetical protein
MLLASMQRDAKIITAEAGSYDSLSLRRSG